jgi:hypothetical protein
MATWTINHAGMMPSQYTIEAETFDVIDGMGVFKKEGGVIAVLPMNADVRSVIKTSG